MSKQWLCLTIYFLKGLDLYQRISSLNVVSKQGKQLQENRLYSLIFA